MRRKRTPTLAEFRAARHVVYLYNSAKWRQLRATTPITQAQIARGMEHYIEAYPRGRHGISRHRALAMLSKTMHL